jgi:nicotinamidase-related amidase
MDPNTTAVLTLDIQQGLLDLAPEAHAVLPAAAMVTRYGREHGMLILHVGLGYEPGYPEIPAHSPLWGKLKELGLFVKGSPSTQIPSTLREPSDTVVYKQQVSGFTDTPLDMILRSQGIKTLTLMGISTSHIVLSTMRSAIEKDYACVVIRDGCYDDEQDVHDVLFDKVFPREATVMTAEKFTQGSTA